MPPVLAAMLLAALLAPLPAQALPDAGDATVVVVVRHAEKAADDPRDPSLSPAGEARAQALAATLAGAGLDAAYSTQYRRTRLTATPAAEAAGLEMQVRPVDAANAASYDAGLAREIRALPPGSTVLVVGHSNTVPGLVRALGAPPAAPMPESEFDRYTVVVVPPGGEPRVLVARY